MTTGTTPKPRVIRFETEWKGEYVPVGCEALNVRLEEIREDRLRAIVAIPRRCTTCGGDGDLHWCTRCDTSLSRPGRLGMCDCGSDLPSPRSAYTERRDCPDCGGTGYGRCPTCAARVVVRDLGLDVETRIVDPPCPDCIDGVLYDEHEVGVREAIAEGAWYVQDAFAQSMGASTTSPEAAVLAALIGERSETP